MSLSATSVAVWERAYDVASKLAIYVLAVLRDLLVFAFSLLKTSLMQLHARLRDFPHEYAAEEQKSEGDSSVQEEVDHVSSEEHWVGAIRGLCRAIVKPDIELVSRALKAAPGLAKTRHDGLWLPLHAAVLSGNVDIVKLVLAQPGIDVSLTDKSSPETADASVREAELGIRSANTTGATALHYACMVGSVDIIKALLKHGAIFDVEDGKGRKPVEYFDVRVHVEAMATYQELFDEWKKRKEHYSESVEIDKLADMVNENNFELFKSSLKKMPELANKFTFYDYTLLHLAVIRQQRTFVEHLLSVAPSTVNKFDRRDKFSSDSSLACFAPPTFPHKYVRVATPLHYACLTGDLAIIKLLLKAGADWDAVDYKNRTPEDLIYEQAEGGAHVRAEFVRLRDEEDVKRKKAKEEEAAKARAREAEEARKAKERADAEKEANKNRNDSNESDPDEKEADDLSSTGSSGSGESGSEESEEEEHAAEKPTPVIRPLEDVLGEKLIGQQGPIRTVANAIRLRENGWVDPDRPLVMLFLGSSGVGKTELAKQVALYMHGKDGLATNKGATVKELEQADGFVRIDMSEFQHKHTVSNLTGAPKGYVGYDDEGFLTSRLRKNPKAIVLLDEIEKAHPDVLTVFLQVFDDGRITDSKRGVIYCKDAVFIMTSNLASDEIKERAPLLRALVAESEAQGRPEEYLRIVGQFNRSIHPILKSALKRDEFLGRINQIAVFLPLSAEEIGHVVKGELDTWRKRAEEKHAIKLFWAAEVVKKLASAYDVNYGVRSVANETQRTAVQLIADAHLRGHLAKNWHAYLTTNELGDIILKASDFREDVRHRRGCRFVHL